MNFTLLKNLVWLVWRSPSIVAIVIQLWALLGSEAFQRLLESCRLFVASEVKSIDSSGISKPERKRLRDLLGERLTARLRRS